MSNKSLVFFFTAVKIISLVAAAASKPETTAVEVANFVAHPTSGANRSSVGTLDSSTVEQTKNHASAPSSKTFKYFHGILNTVSWGIVMPIGFITMMTLKFASPNSLVYLHFFQTSAYLVGAAGWATGLILMRRSHGITYKYHMILGTIIFGCATLQVLIALVRRPSPNHRNSIIWYRYHSSVGFMIFIMSIANIYEGFLILQPARLWTHVFGAIFIFLGAYDVLLNMISWRLMIRRHNRAALVPSAGTA